MAKNVEDIVYEGWLTKSPPTKRIWRARWRRRWFSLTHSGELPGQFVLSYYTDRNRRKQKGVIDLDHCEQVDLGLKLEERKLKFDHVFDIKTPTRTYYLAADNEHEMKSWVNCICKVCGLKAASDEEIHISMNPVSNNVIEEEIINDSNCNYQVTSQCENLGDNNNPYIPISQCITGSVPVRNPQDLKILVNYEMSRQNYINDIADPRFYDCPRQLHPHQISRIIQDHDDTLTSQNDGDSDSVFIDDEEWDPNTSDLNTSKKSRPSDSSADIDITVTQKFTKMTLDSNNKRGELVMNAPPRPPKPQQLSSSANYLNLPSPPTKNGNSDATNSKENEEDKDKQNENRLITDDMYDFPRSHQVECESLRNTLARRHCYNNAAPSTVEGQIFRYDISPKTTASIASPIFKYDGESVMSVEEPPSPLSEGNSIVTYSNLPSPLLTDTQLMPPPIVNRDLKPKRKLSDSLSIHSNNEPPSPRGLVSHHRSNKSSLSMQETIQKQGSIDDEPRKIRAAPSPTPGLSQSHEALSSPGDKEEQIYHFLPGTQSLKHNSLIMHSGMQYLDLNFEDESKDSTIHHSLRTKSPGPGTEYKEVDFMKTKAFNITRNNLEKERNGQGPFLKKTNDSK